MKSLLTLSVLAITLCGCFSPPRRQVMTPFNEADFKSFVVSGTATIDGQAFAKTRGGDVKYAAGNLVYLMPATDYTRELVNIAQQGKVPLRDDRVQQFIRNTRADGFGNFSFNQVPAGTYYVECGIFWEIPEFRYTTYTTGTWLRTLISVKAGEKIKVVLGP